MAFPVAPIRYPTALTGKTNGKLPSSILLGIPSLHGGKDTTLLRASSARAFRAMRDASERAGVRQESVSSYRPYAVQEAIFRERYVPHFARHTDGSVRFKTWNGVRWYHAFGATAAVPGSSNHGLALADDFVTSPKWQTWMLANAARFGWSWEIQSESWHLRYVAGDAIPQAVLDYEASLQPLPPEPLPGDEDMPAICKATNDQKEYVCNGIERRYITDRAEANMLAFTGQAKYGPGGKAFPVDPAALARLPIRKNP